MAAIELLILGLTPVLAFGGSLVGHVVTRRTATELDRWRKREETMRLLRWATELAVDGDADRARAGLVVLQALLDSPLLDDADIQLVATVTDDVAAHRTDQKVVKSRTGIETMKTSPLAGPEDAMTDQSKPAPDPIAVLAAQVRMKADRRLKRDSPAWIKELAAAGKDRAS